MMSLRTFGGNFFCCIHFWNYSRKNLKCMQYGRFQGFKTYLLDILVEDQNKGLELWNWFSSIICDLI